MKLSRKRGLVLAFVVMLVVAFIVGGCTSGKDTAEPAQEQESKAEAPKEVLNLTFATTMEDTGIDRELTQKFKQRLEELSGGTMTVTLYMSGQMGSEREALEQLKLGELDLGYNVVQSDLYYPEYNVTILPFLFPDMETIEEFMAGPIGDKIKDAARTKGGVIPLGIHGYGPRWTTSNVPFRNAEELKGLKIRMPNMPPWIKIWKSMGANPTPIAAPEIVTALKTGTVDAQENFLTNIYGRQMWEYQKYLIATKHVNLFQTWLVSEKTWNKLSSEQRQILQKAIDDAIAYVKPKIDEMNEEFVRKCEENGMEIIYPDRESLMEAAQPAIKEIIENDLAPEAYEEALKVINQ